MAEHAWKLEHHIDWECGGTQGKPAALETKTFVGVMAHQLRTESPEQRTWDPT